MLTLTTTQQDAAHILALCASNRWLLIIEAVDAALLRRNGEAHKLARKRFFAAARGKSSATYSTPVIYAEAEAAIRSGR